MSAVKGEYWIRGIGTPPSFKNKRFIKAVKGRIVSFTDPQKKKWMDDAVEQLKRQREVLGEPAVKRKPTKVARYLHACSVVVEVYAKDMKTADCDGMLTTLTDCLTKAGVIADDSPRYVRSVSLGHYYHPDAYCGGEEVECVKIEVK